VRFDAAAHSDEVEETPASDSQCAAVTHLGRACAKAYRGEDECSGGFGAENRSLAWPAVSNGASPAMALRRSCYGCCCTRERRKKRERSGGQNGTSGRGVPSRPG